MTAAALQFSSMPSPGPMKRVGKQHKQGAASAGHRVHAPRPSGDLHQPSFSAHSVELSPLCDEVGRRVHLRNVASVHDDHSEKGTDRRKMCFRSSFYRYKWTIEAVEHHMVPGVIHDGVKAVSDGQDGAVFKLCTDC